MLWQQACENDWIILTRDADFFDRLLIHGPPPKVVWVRLGNLRKKDLIETLVGRWPSIENQLKSYDLIEVYTDRLEALSFPR